MDSQVSHNDKRRIIATDSVLVSVVQRLVERGIIQHDEADDMLALLSAVSDLSTTSLETSGKEWRQRGRSVRRRPAGPTN